MKQGKCANLLTKYGYPLLLSGLKLGKLNQTIRLLQPLIKDDHGSQSTAAMAYLIGIKQGVHNERARRAVLNVHLADGITDAAMHLEKAECIMQDITEDHFGRNDPESERGQAAILYDHNHYRIKAEIVTGYLFKVRKQLETLESLAEQNREAHDMENAG